MLGASFLPAPGQKKPAPKTDEYATKIAPLIKKYCGACHGASNPAAKLNLIATTSEAQVVKAAAKWEKVVSRLGSSTMPPMGAPQPTKAQRELMTTWLETKLSDCKLADPGRVTIRRLNRAEYDNTIRDLVGVDFKPAEDFPSDDVGHGFDNIGDVLSISPLLMEKYLDAAEKIASMAIVVSDESGKRYVAEDFATDGECHVRDGEVRYFSRGSAEVVFKAPADGSYIIKARAWAQQAGPDLAQMQLSIDGKSVRYFPVEGTQQAPGTYEYQARLKAGTHTLRFSFVNDYYRREDPNPQNRDRNLFLIGAEVVASDAKPKVLPASHKRIIFVQPAPGEERQAARKILAKFARRAYRRPVTNDEVDALVRVYDLAAKEREGFERGIQLGVQAALVSPHFLFRVERDQGPRALNSHELASRLSYFLWSSMPDDTLFALADKGGLQKPEVLQAQVKRMLADPRAKALAENFATQWLQLRKLDTINPDTTRFPFSEELRASMLKETLLFFRAVVSEDRSVLDFIDGKFSYINEPLAQHYGIEGVKGDSFRKVALTGQRAGVLTQASVLTVTSNPTRTSPVKRGKWVLENILGEPPPPPPPGVDNLTEDAKKLEGRTLRELMAEHRKNPSCANCHARMDNIGFGLENFDAVGRWRSQEAGRKVDASGKLPDGRSFATPLQLIAILKADKERFLDSLSERMLTYATGRGLTPADKCYIDEVAKATTKKQYKFSALVTAVVLSEPFRRRK